MVIYSRFVHKQGLKENSTLKYILYVCTEIFMMRFIDRCKFGRCCIFFVPLRSYRSCAVMTSQGDTVIASAVKMVFNRRRKKTPTGLKDAECSYIPMQCSCAEFQLKLNLAL